MLLSTKLSPDSIKFDLAAGFVVFLVALPLCLGIALASEAPPLSGLITGVVAGLLVSILSGSELSVSGPAAGLAVTVIATQRSLGGLEGLFVATMISGIFQIALGAIRVGHLATFFPSSVIKGMLAGIGIIIAFKQIPLAVGWRGEFNPENGIFCFFSPFCIHGLYYSLLEPHIGISLGAICISITSITILVGWEGLVRSYGGAFKTIPGALVAVLIGIALNQMLTILAPSYSLTAEQGQLVTIPRIKGLSDLLSNGPANLWNWLVLPKVWLCGIVIALIGSVETLLSIEATDKLDPLRRVSRPNRELMAQGTGNIVAGILGGIPLTAVIVRSSANVYAGGRTRISAFVHGLLLLVSVIAIPEILNSIPLSALAAVLIVVGYKLANVKLFTQMWRTGYDQFLPFLVTVLGVVFLDLLSGVIIGTVFGLAVVLIMNHHAAFTMVRDGRFFFIRFAKDVTFLQKIALKRCLARLPEGAQVTIEGRSAMFIDHDILELINDFKESAKSRDIILELRNFPDTKLDLITAITNRNAAWMDTKDS
jgi:MFS superfamily sulfate permease-like transporter